MTERPEMDEAGGIDLHLHSTFSDGTFPPEEVVRRAVGRGLSVISLTDHDSVSGVARASQAGEELGVEVIPGAELSANVDGTDVHILAHFVDPQHEELNSCFETYRDARRVRAEKMVKKLNKMGIRVGMEQVLAKAGEGAIGRPHVADVMLEEGFVFSTNEAFHKYIGFRKPAYEAKYAMPPLEAIQLIHSAGGLASLAHPKLYSRDDLIPALVNDGLDGIEVRHIRHDAGDVARYSTIAEENGLLKTGGSDCHGDGRGDAVIGTVPVPREFLTAMREASRSRSADS
jgi:predicted metal-dependent phosphoesterase TrpH